MLQGGGSQRLHNISGPESGGRSRESAEEGRGSRLAALPGGHWEGPTVQTFSWHEGKEAASPAGRRAGRCGCVSGRKDRTEPGWGDRRWAEAGGGGEDGEGLECHVLSGQGVQEV